MSEPRHTRADGSDASTMRWRASQTGGSTPAAFQTCVPAIDPNVGMPEQFLLQDSTHNTLRLGENVNVVEECENPLVSFQSFLRGHESKILSNCEEYGVILKDVRFCPILNFGHFWAALLKDVTLLIPPEMLAIFEHPP